MRDATFTPSLKSAWTRAISDAHVLNSPCDITTRSGGQVASKLVTLSGAGNPVNTDLFTITGAVDLFNIYGIFEDVTNVVDIEEVDLALYDQINTVPLTLAATLDCDGVLLNALLIRSDTSGNALVKLDSDQVRIDEASKQTILSAVIINAKQGAATVIRMRHKNTDTNLNCQIRWYAEWRHLSAHTSGTLVAV